MEPVFKPRGFDYELVIRRVPRAQWAAIVNSEPRELSEFTLRILANYGCVEQGRSGWVWTKRGRSFKRRLGTKLKSYTYA